MKKIFKKILSIYNNLYGIINAIICLLLLSNINNQTLQLIVIAVGVWDCFTWYKNVAKNFKTKTEFYATCRDNNVMAIYGGVGAGKTTMATHLLNKFVPRDLQFTNTATKDLKIFHWRHLALLEKLPDGCGVLIDEAGRQYDSFKYEKSDSDLRARIIAFNKFFRQFYGDRAFSIYVDQCEANLNTALYRSIFYVIQCKGCSKKRTGIIPYYLFELVNLFRKNKLQNPFQLVSIEFMEFNKMGEYAEHYSVNIEDKDHKLLVCPIQEMFGNHNTYVFKDFNPAKIPDNYLVWGVDSKLDEKYMNNNFSLESLKNELNIKGIDLPKE